MNISLQHHAEGSNRFSVARWAEEVFTIACTNLCSLARWILRLVALGHLHALHQSFQITDLKVTWSWA